MKSVFKLLLLAVMEILLVVPIANCQMSENPADNIQPRKKFTIFSASYQDCRGIYLVVHGLNNHPAVMDELIAEINKAGYSAIRVELTGHELDETQSRSDFISRKISAASWIEDVDDAFAQSRETCSGKPVGVLGFSLGAATLINYLDTHPDTKVAKAIFIAPAIGIFRFVNFMRAFLPLKYLGIPSVSFAPEGYRRYLFPSFKIYSGLFEIYKNVQNLSQNKNLKAANPVFILSRGDELIDEDKVKEWIKRNNLEKESKIIEIKFAPGSEPEYEHQIIDVKSTGVENWKVIADELGGELEE